MAGDGRALGSVDRSPKRDKDEREKMKRIRIVGLSIVAAFALSAMAAASASAASPEYKICKKVSSGAEFSDKVCMAAKGGGKGYALVKFDEGKKVTFKSKGSKPINYLVNPCIQKADIEKKEAVSSEACLASKAVGQFEAASSKASGKLTGPKTSTFIEEFTKVKSGASSCNSPGKGPGKITTFELETELVSLGGGKVGEVVKAVGGGLLAEYTCGSVLIKVKGAVIAEIVGASGPATKSFSVTVSSNGGNKDNLQKYMYLPGTGEADTAGNAAGSEDNGADYFGFARRFGECLKEGKTAGECGGLIGGPFAAEEGYAPPGTAPITLLSELSSPKVTLPAAQNGTGEVKGEMLKIV